MDQARHALLNGLGRETKTAISQAAMRHGIGLEEVVQGVRGAELHPSVALSAIAAAAELKPQVRIALRALEWPAPPPVVRQRVPSSRANEAPLGAATPTETPMNNPPSGTIPAPATQTVAQYLTNAYNSLAPLAATVNDALGNLTAAMDELGVPVPQSTGTVAGARKK